MVWRAMDARGVVCVWSEGPSGAAVREKKAIDKRG